MKLAELEPVFLKRDSAREFHCVPDLAGADGIEFLCPKCFREKIKDARGGHVVICWAPQVPQDTAPTPGRWTMQGTGVHDLTLVAGSSSVLLTAACKAHFFVRNGEIVDC